MERLEGDSDEVSPSSDPEELSPRGANPAVGCVFGHTSMFNLQSDATTCLDVTTLCGSCDHCRGSKRIHTEWLAAVQQPLTGRLVEPLICLQS